ncbi:MAG: KamA family radical SAM protein [Polyangiaceae bacterium]|jgi:lysine 2,3-aminomutase|nr:KamA family radical SAM protein [Polyangiaceae bacterium]
MQAQPRLPLLPVAEANPSDWRWQIRHAITSVEALETSLRLTPEEREGARRAQEQGLPISITPYYLSLCDPHDPACPVRLQCVPRAEEAQVSPGDMEDPLGEVAHEVAPELVQRYPDRALLLVTDRCAVYCRFCTRSRMVGDGGGARSLDRLEPAFQYLESHPQIRDVIVSGGDPMAMATERLVAVLQRLRRMEHLDTIRIATRVPVTLPQRVTGELIEALRPLHPLWVMTHFNHPKELSPEALEACRRLADGGFPVMNQTVLLRGINDDAGTLERLFRGLIRARVRPYYLLQADPVKGTGHLRTSIDRGLALMEALQGRLTGIALPKYIVDTPGGMGKVPVLPGYVVARRPGETDLRTYRGVVVTYRDPPEG